MALVPLFLHAIIEELKAGSELPHGRQAMLRRMAERAVEEHRSAIEHGEVKEHAARYLRDLAWEMTRLGRTTLPAEEACRRVAGTIGELQQEALLGERPPPPDILKQLCAGHLLISTLENGVDFTHQLIQEHFAATEITSVLGAAVSGRHAAAALPREVLTEYQWEQPLFLALEDLAEQNRVSEITLLLDWFRLVDFEAACRMCPVVSSFWPTVRNLFQPVIRHLASLEDVNARWLAARCAAATGQPEFEDIVWVALAGHPEGNLDCFEGMSATFILGALDGQSTEQLLQVASEDFRFEALLAIGLAPSSDSLEVAECLAIQDSAAAVRRLAFRQLFLSGRRGWIRRFLYETKEQGRPLGLLRVLSVSPRCTTTLLRKLLRWQFGRNAAAEERTKVLRLWNELDASGASAIARSEYDHMPELPAASSGDFEFRHLCLNTGARDDCEWAIPRVLREAFSPNGPSVWEFLPLNVLPDTDRAKVVAPLLPTLARRHDPTRESVRRMAELAPIVAAECLLRGIAESARASAASEEQRNLEDSRHKVNRTAVIEAVLRAEFAEPSPVELGPLIRALDTGSPGGDPDSLQSVDEGRTLGAYRERLLHWLALLPVSTKSLPLTGPPARR